MLTNIFSSTNYVRSRLLPIMRKREQVLSILAFVGSIVGGAGLILLSIFDTRRFTSLHRAFLLVFILGVAFSAIFTVIEVCHSCTTGRKTHGHDSTAGLAKISCTSGISKFLTSRKPLLPAFSSSCLSHSR